MTNFNSYLDEFSNFVSITSNKDKFIKEINNQIKNPRPSILLREFGKKFDWRMISAQYYNLIKDAARINKNNLSDLE